MIGWATLKGCLKGYLLVPLSINLPYVLHRYPREGVAESHQPTQTTLILALWEKEHELRLSSPSRKGLGM